MPGLWRNHTGPWVCGGGGGRRALGWGPGADPMAQTTLDMPRTHLRNGDIPGAQREGVRTHQHTRETRCTHKTGCSTEQRGGIALHGGPTRRRHAVRRLHVVQTPTTSGVEGAVGIAHLAGVPPSAKEHAQHGNYSKSKRSRPLLRTHIFHVKPPAPMLASPG